MDNDTAMLITFLVFCGLHWYWLAAIAFIAFAFLVWLAP